MVENVFGVWVGMFWDDYGQSTSIWNEFYLK